MCDFMPQPWIRLHNLFSHGCPCDPNTNSAFAQSQQRKKMGKTQAGDMGWAGTEPSPAPLPGTAPVATGRASPRSPGGDSVQKKQEHNAIY